MSILTKEIIKGLLDITDSSRDSFIDKNLMSAEAFLFSRTNNFFEIATNQFFVESNNISFANGTPSKILDSESGFVDAGFVDGMVFRIKGSYLNDGVVPVSTVTAGEITLQAGHSLSDEDYSLNIRITIVRLPEPAKLFVAKYLEFHFPNKSTTEGIKSEKFDDYSVTFKDSSEIPKSIMSILDPYRRLSWV